MIGGVAGGADGFEAFVAEDEFLVAECLRGGGLAVGDAGDEAVYLVAHFIQASEAL